jgi:hypothetical protein
LTSPSKGEHTFLPHRGFIVDVTPQEQKGNIPVIGKFQIITGVGTLMNGRSGGGVVGGVVDAGAMDRGGRRRYDGQRQQQLARGPRHRSRSRRRERRAAPAH